MPTHNAPAGHESITWSRKDLDKLRAYFRENDPTHARRSRRSSVGRVRRKRMRATTRLAPAQQALLDKATELGFPEAELMDRLQNLGLISDLAVWLEDVAEADCVEALKRAPWKR